MKHLGRAVGALLLPTLLLTLLWLLSGPQPVASQAGVTNFTTVSASRDVVAGRDVQAGGDVLVSGLLVTARAAQTVTMNGAITPVAAYMQLTSAGNVGTNNILTGTAGQRLTLVNGVNTTITISDSGRMKLSGNIALGQYDSLQLISDGANWVQLSTSDN